MLYLKTFCQMLIYFLVGKILSQSKYSRNLLKFFLSKNITETYLLVIFFLSKNISETYLLVIFFLSKNISETYLLVIFFLKNATSLSFFSSWSSINLEKQKILLENPVPRGKIA